MAWSTDSIEQFQVVEKWSNLWKQWIPNTPECITYAFRSLETGDLVYRTTDRVPLQPTNMNAAGTLGVADDGHVYRLPLPVNWPLLAFCQLVLATPMLLIWGVLRWRRGRRASAPGLLKLHLSR
jgi:hypothetical protein